MASRKDRIDQLRHKLERMEALEREQARKAEARRKIVLGAALDALFARRPDIKKTLMPQLLNHITRAHDREAIGLPRDLSEAMREVEKAARPVEVPKAIPPAA